MNVAVITRKEIAGKKGRCNRVSLQFSEWLGKNNRRKKLYLEVLEWNYFNDIRRKNPCMNE